MKEDMRKKKDGGINARYCAEKIQEESILIFFTGDFYEYNGGCYYKCNSESIKKKIMDMLGDEYTLSNLNEIFKTLRIVCYIDEKYLNWYPGFSLKNGMYDVGSNKIHSHTPAFKATVQLNVNYDKDAICPKWEKTLDEVFLGNRDKINALQEYFGLCLTKEIKYQKALFCLGDGANGKSTVLYVLESLLGRDNYSAVPVEQFKNRHYLAELHGKLANISAETKVKSDICDSAFKTIVTGDSTHVDRKFKAPFVFDPFCKLIFALNEMPRSDDKSDAYFRRIFIIRFSRKFEGAEDNKNLKYELVKELDGIFLWALEGLKRLEQRGRFVETKEMQQEISCYRRENNSVLVFAREECDLSLDLRISKDTLYQNYSDWSKKSGLGTLSKIRFGKQLTIRFPSILEDRESDSRCWVGIDIKGSIEQDSMNDWND